MKAWVLMVTYVGACMAGTSMVGAWAAAATAAALGTATTETASAAAVGAAAVGAVPPRAPSALYARLGGAPGVAAIADTLIDRVAADPLTGPSFKGSNLDRIKRLLAEQICDLSGGPCHYSGDSMKEVHAGHQISQAQFYRMVETLRTVLQERRVDLRSTNQLLRLLAPMKRDVVEHPTAKPPPSAAQ